MTILDFLREYQVPIKLVGDHHHATTNFIQTDCPFCSPGSDKFRLGIANTGTHAICWTCGTHQTASVLALLTQLPLRKILEFLEELDRPPRAEILERRGKLVIPSGVYEMGPAHRKYLKGRGFDPQEIETLWKVKGIGIAPRLQWRLWIPIHSLGEIISWTTRAIGDQVTAKYVNASPDEEILSPKSILYGHDLVRHAMIICEGPTDCWRIGPGAVATMGVGFTPAQLLKMSKCMRRIVCFDNDQAGQQRAEQLSEQLSMFPGITENIILDADDPGSASPKEIKALRKMLK